MSVFPSHLTALLIARLSVDDIRRVGHRGEPQTVGQLAILLLQERATHTYFNGRKYRWVRLAVKEVVFRISGK